MLEVYGRMSQPGSKTHKVTTEVARLLLQRAHVLPGQINGEIRPDPVSLVCTVSTYYIVHCSSAWPSATISP